MTEAQHINSLNSAIDNIGWLRTMRGVNIALSFMQREGKVHEHDTLVRAWLYVIHKHESRSLVP